MRKKSRPRRPYYDPLIITTIEGRRLHGDPEMTQERFDELRARLLEKGLKRPTLPPQRS